MDVVNTITPEMSWEQQADFINEVRKSVPYQRIAVMDELAQRLARQPEGSVVLASLLAELTGLAKLGSHIDATSPEIMNELKGAVAGYTQAMIDSRPPLPREHVAALAKRYHGRIGVHPPNPEQAADIAASSEAMLALLREWPPLGARMADLASIVGWPGDGDERTRIYRFDTGLGGLEFQILLHEGIIRSVRIVGID